MNASATIKRNPWAFGLALAIGVCALADIGLALHLRSAAAQRSLHRDRVRTMETLAEEFRALKAQSEVAGQVLPPGIHLTPDAVTAIAKERGIAGHISTTSASPTRHDEHLQEQIIDLGHLRDLRVSSRLRSSGDTSQGWPGPMGRRDEIQVLPTTSVPAHGTPQRQPPCKQLSH